MRHVLIALFAVLCLPLAATLQAADTVAALTQDMAATDTQWTPARFARVADRYGKLVDEARAHAAAVPALEALRVLGDRVHAGIRTHVRAMEHAAGENEQALEQLYRSDQWYGINRALAGVRYWQAWLDLGVATASREESRRVSALIAAERGFQATTVRILYPGLVYGSWLGLAYVAQARGDDALAQQRLEMLAQALSSDPDNPLRPIVVGELAILAARRGEISATLPPADVPLSAVDARRLAEEAFALLEARRRSAVMATPAAERLKRLAMAGYLDDALLQRMLAYRDELVGSDAGIISLLLDAEFAYAHRQYETTVLKYRAFAGAGGFDLALRFAPFRYHYAVALQQLGQTRESLDVARRLRADVEIGPRAAKLCFLLAQRLNSEQPDAANRAAMESAAQDYLRALPKDADAAIAHAVLAASAGSSQARAQHLSRARGDPRLRDSVDRVALEGALARFSAAGSAGDWPARAAVAREALGLMAHLQREQRRLPLMRALELQMQVAAEQVPAQAEERIAALADAAPTDANLQRLLAWARLRLMDSERGSARWLAHIESLTQGEADSALGLELFAYVQETRARAEPQQFVDLCQRALPVYAQQPDLRRQLQLMQVKALALLGRHDEAFALTRDMVLAYPRSGNAWQAYAESAEAAHDVFAAERGWATIAAAEAQGSPRWIDAVLRRVAAMKQSAAADAAYCGLLLEAQGYRARMSAAQRLRLDQWLDQTPCRAQAS